ncbi:MAG: tRNA methyltransferase [Alphaproteobacteria bacterium]|nr:tRNA methyltransferase [Alphaproteobacteria bacterium]
MRLALYQPDIPQNTGALLRLAACFAVPTDIIEPCGFVFDDRKLRRSGMDYIESVALFRHSTWETFLAAREKTGGRLLLLSSRAETPFTAFAFHPDDTLLLGRESAGVPEHVRAAAPFHLRVPIAPGLRSLNVVAAAAVVLGEALRQTNGFPANSFPA